MNATTSGQVLFDDVTLSQVLFDGTSSSQVLFDDTLEDESSNSRSLMFPSGFGGENMTAELAMFLRYVDISKKILFAFRFCISPPICLLGCVGNTLVIVTFVRMGLTDGVTIGFFNLALSDNVVILVQLLDFLQRAGPLQNLKDMVESLEHVGFNLTAFITTFLSLQRCLCVLLPLQFKGMFTRARSFIIVGVVWVYSLSLGVFGTVNYLMKVAGARGGATTPSQDHMEHINENLLLVNAVILRPACSCVVLVCLVTMVLVLNRSVKFRLSATGAKKDRSSSPGVNDFDEVKVKQKGRSSEALRVDSKEKQVIIQVALVSTLFLLASYRETEPHLRNFIFNHISQSLYRSFFYMFFIATGSLAETVVHINSSVNFLIYYKFNTKFRKICFSRRSEYSSKSSNTSGIST